MTLKMYNLLILSTTLACTALASSQPPREARAFPFAIPPLLQLGAARGLGVPAEVQKKLEGFKTLIELFKQYKGDIPAIKNDPRLASIQPLLQADLKELTEKAGQAHTMLTSLMPAVSTNFGEFYKYLQDPAFAALIGNLSPTLSEIASLVQTFLGSVTKLTGQVAELKNNPALQELVGPQPATTKP